MSNIQLNFNGFSTRTLIDNNKVSATSISLSATENIIQFDGAYGGEMNYKEDNYFRLNTPSFYELPEISCSIGTEITFKQIKKLFFDWFENRGKAHSVLISSGDESNKTFNFEKCCYFKSLKLQTSQNSLVTADYDFYVNSRNLFNEPIKNNVPKLQSETKEELVFDPTLQNKDKVPIGYWETEIEGFYTKKQKFDENGGPVYDKDKKQVLDWSLSFSQNVIPKYYCGRETDVNVAEPPLPDLMIGYPKMELNVTFLMDKEEFDEDVFAEFSDNKKIIYPQKEDKEIENKENPSSNQLSLKIRGKEICRFLYGKVNSYSPSLSNGAITFSSTYLIHQIYLTYDKDDE
jgi:hypothetical protein